MIPKDTAIEVSIDIPGFDRPVVLEGKVAYVLEHGKAREIGRLPGMGIQFVDAEAPDHKLLDVYLKRLSTHRSRRDHRVGDAVPLSGALGEYLTPEILIHLREKELTGTLQIKRDDIWKNIYVKDGKPIYVESNLRADALGPYILRKKRLKPSDLEASLLALTESDLALGEILIIRNLIDAQTLSAALVSQHEEKISNMFRWLDGTYEFKEGMDWPENISMLPLRLITFYLKEFLVGTTKISCEHGWTLMNRRHYAA